MYNARKLTVLMAIVAVVGCAPTGKYSYTDYQSVAEEPLFCIYNKTNERGTFTFIINDDNQIRQTSFTYSIYVDGKTVACHKSEDIILNSQDERLNGHWLTAAMFKGNEKGTRREAYWNCFSDDFLDMSNAEKMKLLEDLSKRRQEQLTALNWFMQPVIITSIQNSDIDDSPYLNANESTLLNSLLIDSAAYDFTNKKVCFLDGLSLGSKMDYFEMFRKISDKETFAPHDIGYWYVFNEEERAMLDNYDAVIVYRPSRPYKKEKVIKALNRKLPIPD